MENESLILEQGEQRGISRAALAANVLAQLAVCKRQGQAVPAVEELHQRALEDITARRQAAGPGVGILALGDKVTI